MAQSQIQEQKQEQRQLQSISAQQLLQSQLIELPLQQMTERIETELHDNPALEKKVNDDDATGEWPSAPADGDEQEDFDAQREREERSDALDAALEGIGRDDEELPVYQGGRQWTEEQEQAVYGEERSFYDMLMDQVGELELTQTDRFVMEYLIQSLDDDGLLRTPLSDICEQLAVYHGIDISTDEATQLLLRLQQMDPAGIGARSLQECLLLQTERRKPSELKELMRRVLINIIRNGIEAAQNAKFEPEIDISLKALDGEKKQLCLSIIDNGPGLTDEQKARLFMPYFTTKSDGTGLGLSIVRKIVEDHNGTITLHDRDDQERGTQADITLVC